MNKKNQFNNISKINPKHQEIVTSNNSHKFNLNQKKCIDHQQKKAKYYSKQNLFVCSKCAFVLASKGYQVSILNQQNLKENALDQFMFDLKKQYQKLFMLYQQLEHNKSHFEQCFNEQINIHKNFFNQFSKILTQFYEKSQNKMFLCYKTCKQNFEFYLQQLQQFQSKILQMNQDVRNNKQKIIKYIDQQGIKKILNGYQQNIKQISLELKNFKIKIQQLSFPQYNFNQVKVNRVIKFLQQIIGINQKNNIKITGSYSTKQSLSKHYKTHDQSIRRFDDDIVIKQFQNKSSNNFLIKINQQKYFNQQKSFFKNKSNKTYKVQGLFDSPVLKETLV